MLENKKCFSNNFYTLCLSSLDVLLSSSVKRGFILFFWTTNTLLPLSFLLTRHQSTPLWYWAMHKKDVSFLHFCTTRYWENETQIGPRKESHYHAVWAMEVECWICPFLKKICLLVNHKRCPLPTCVPVLSYVIIRISLSF